MVQDTLSNRMVRCEKDIAHLQTDVANIKEVQRDCKDSKTSSTDRAVQIAVVILMAIGLALTWWHNTKTSNLVRENTWRPQISE